MTFEFDNRFWNYINLVNHRINQEEEIRPKPKPGLINDLAKTSDSCGKLIVYNSTHLLIYFKTIYPDKFISILCFILVFLIK